MQSFERETTGGRQQQQQSENDTILVTVVLRQQAAAAPTIGHRKHNVVFMLNPSARRARLPHVVLVDVAKRRKAYSSSLSHTITNRQ